MNNEYTEEKLAEIEQDIISGLDKEKNFLKEIEDIARFITKEFLSGKHHVNYDFQDKKYIFSLEADKNSGQIILMRTDPIKLMIGNGHYVPAIFRAEYDKSFTYEENIFMVVKTSLCSAAGIIHTDLLTEEEDI